MIFQLPPPGFGGGGGGGSGGTSGLDAILPTNDLEKFNFTMGNKVRKLILKINDNLHQSQ
jgi:hypothetical protein